MNDKISIKNLIKIQVRSDLYDVSLKYSNKEEKDFITINKGVITDPVLLKYDMIGNQSITISSLEDNNTFNVNFDFELVE